MTLTRVLSDFRLSGAGGVCAGDGTSDGADAVAGAGDFTGVSGEADTAGAPWADEAAGTVIADGGGYCFISNCIRFE